MPESTYDLYDDDRYTTRADRIEVGDLVWSAALRWETVTGVEALPHAPVRVTTDRTGDGFAWTLHAWAKVPIVRLWPNRADAAVVIDEDRITVTVFVGNQRYWHRASQGAPLLANAWSNGRGAGWTVHIRNGDEVVTTSVDSKAKAMPLIRQTANRHAKALGLPVRTASRDGAW